MLLTDDPEPSEPSQYQSRRNAPYAQLLLSLVHCLGNFPSHPRSCRQHPHHPVLRGENHCPYCLCAPCVIALPPDFIRGSSSPQPANVMKSDTGCIGCSGGC